MGNYSGITAEKMTRITQLTTRRRRPGQGTTCWFRHFTSLEEMVDPIHTASRRGTEFG
jgi:hypothetical protein